MYKADNDWISSLLHTVRIPSEDIPEIELYMDQVTTFMDSRLDSTRRHPDDKIMTKTMINNYTKNHLLPPSVKKKYRKEHVFLLILIYHLKNVLSISDIQAILGPLTEKYFPKDATSDVTLEEIYERTTKEAENRFPEIEKEILQVWEDSKDQFSEHDLSPEDKEYLDTFSFIYQLSYDIYVRKQLIEKLIDIQHVSSEKENGKGKHNK